MELQSAPSGARELSPAPFVFLDRLLAKYRSDVHQLQPGAPAEAITALEGHLQQRLPPELRTFLARHNGGALFRGSLRLRSTSSMASASDQARGVVLFADGPGESRWAWAVGPDATYVFGVWDGERLDPLHTTFSGWFAASVAVLETRVVHAVDLEELRLEVDPGDVLQMIRAGRRRLQQGNPEEAERLLRKATQLAPNHAQAWQHLGDALAIADRSAARMAWLRAFRCTRLPQPWPGAPCLDPEVLRSLSLVFSEAEKWEEELHRFLTDRVQDLDSSEASELVASAAGALARSLVRRGRRREAREVLVELLSRFHGFTRPQTPWQTLLELARLELDLGHHDEAEALLRRVRLDGPDALRARALVLLARIAIHRQEPWAEDILDEAEVVGAAAGQRPDDEDQLWILLLRIERFIRHDRPVQARSSLAAARKLARRMGVRGWEAAVAYAEGEVLRLEQQPTAADAYRRAQQLIEERDPELRYRAELRLGDLALAAGDRARAERHYRAGVGGFRRFELPVREAWGLLRLARLALETRQDPGGLLEAARERFITADLAAGIAVVDSLAGDPGASLGWHLERATAQARARHDAQRARPPWTRADADRPERRLGAHRIAIAACGEAVVEALAGEMAACVRATQAGRGRPKDPAVLRYVAAVDLLSGHRSYSAATVLLNHLLQGVVEGPAYRALQGAIARSPNAALVDGLLRCVERPLEHPGHAVAAAAELLGLRREPAAIRPLMRLAGPRQRPTGRRAAVVALGRIGNRQTVEAIAECLEEPTLAEAAALALLMLGDRRGVDFHGRALLESRRDLHGHPGELVGRYGGPDHLLLLANAADGSDDRALGALQGLGLLGDPRAAPTLLKALHRRERKVVEVAAGALELLTGHEEDLDTPGARNRWHAWWESNSGRFKEGVRYRAGRIFDAGLLLEWMEHPDAWTRRTAYDELVITTGKDLPFDADGPWRVQQAHLRAWRKWWATARHQHVSGRWYLDGRAIH